MAFTLLNPNGSKQPTKFVGVFFDELLGEFQSNWTEKHIDIFKLLNVHKLICFVNEMIKFCFYYFKE